MTRRQRNPPRRIAGPSGTAYGLGTLIEPPGCTDDAFPACTAREKDAR